MGVRGSPLKIKRLGLAIVLPFPFGVFAAEVSTPLLRGGLGPFREKRFLQYRCNTQGVLEFPHLLFHLVLLGLLTLYLLHHQKPGETQVPKIAPEIIKLIVINTIVSFDFFSIWINLQLFETG